MSDYGDDVSDVESVASLFHEERKIEEEQKRLYKDDENVDEEKNTETTVKDKWDIYENFKRCIFQNVSNDKMYILQIKKISVLANDK